MNVSRERLLHALMVTAAEEECSLISVSHSSHTQVIPFFFLSPVNTYEMCLVICVLFLYCFFFNPFDIIFGEDVYLILFIYLFLSLHYSFLYHALYFFFSFCCLCRDLFRCKFEETFRVRT